MQISSYFYAVRSGGYVHSSITRLGLRMAVVSSMLEGDTSIMINSSVRFDVFQQLVLWLNKSMKSYREGHHYLTTNTILTADEADKELTRLISAHAQDQPEMLVQMHQHQHLLRDARNRGGNIDAMREAYINIFGGWILDIPSWLTKIEEDLLFLNKLGRPERTKFARIRLLQDAINFAEQDERVEPEVIAELYNELGALFLQSPRPHSYKAHVQNIQHAINCHKTALDIYTIARYPFQYARSQILLGVAYHHYGVASHPSGFERAIDCYQDALRVYTPEEFPERWTRLHTYLGNAFALRSDGDYTENIEQSIAHHLGALYMLNDACSPLTNATIHLHLGDAHNAYQVGERKKNLDEAVNYYKAAMKTLSLQDFPYEWACIHVRLASIFQQEELANDGERDMYLRCAIVCYEGALDIYRPDAFPVEYAEIQVRLAYVHLLRKEGEQQQHLDQAMECYRKALPVFSKNAFPREHDYIRQMIGWIETQPHEKDPQIFPSFHAPFNSCIMVKSS
jgi:tetratricopeptide (TPR) repeat protein